MTLNEDFFPKNNIENNLSLLEQENKRLRLENESFARENKKFREMVKSSKDIFISINNHGQVTYFNRAAENIFGINHKDILGKNLSDILPVEFQEQHQEMVESYFSTGKPNNIVGKTIELIAQKADGQKFPIELSLSACQSGDEKIVYAIVRDISERKIIENQINSNLQFLEKVIDSLDHPFYVIDVKNYKILLANKSSGFTSMENYSCHSLSHGKDTPCAQTDEDCPLEIVKKTKKPVTVKHYHQYPESNEKKIFEIHCHPILDENNEVGQVIEYCIDKTNEEKLIEQLVASQKMESLATLTGGIAHNFNNLLGIILGYTELSEFDLEPGSYLYNNIQSIKTAAQRAGEIIKSILQYSRKESSKRQYLTLENYIKNTTKLIKATLPLNIELQLIVNCRDSNVFIDTNQFDQVLMNLCNNASQAMEQHGGKILITLENQYILPKSADASSDLLPGKYLKITVEDNGCGIPKHIINKIFDPFFTTKEVGKGTGLGLSTSYGIIKEHHGNISVESVPGVKTTFQILLPCVEEKNLNLLASKTSLSKNPEMIEANILLVDDLLEMLNIGSKLIQKIGGKVFTSQNGLEALECIKKQKNIDLIITDFSMKGMNGLELAKNIHQINPDIPIILCTGNLEPDCIESQSLGIKKILKKPYTSNELTAAIKEALNKKQS